MACKLNAKEPKERFMLFSVRFLRSRIYAVFTLETSPRSSASSRSLMVKKHPVILFFASSKEKNQKKEHRKSGSRWVAKPFKYISNCSLGANEAHHRLSCRNEIHQGISFQLVADPQQKKDSRCFPCASCGRAFMLVLPLRHHPVHQLPSGH